MTHVEHVQLDSMGWILSGALIVMIKIVLAAERSGKEIALIV
jgi:hypothetical protein